VVFFSRKIFFYFSKEAGKHHKAPMKTNLPAQKMAILLKKIIASRATGYVWYPLPKTMDGQYRYAKNTCLQNHQGLRKKNPSPLLPLTRSAPTNQEIFPMTDTDKNTRKPDPNRVAFLRSLPVEVKERITGDEAEAFMFTTEIPQSLYEKIKDYITEDKGEEG